MLTSTPTPSSQGLHVTFRGGDVCAGCRLTGRDQVRGSRPRGTRAPVLTRWPPLQGRLLRISHAAGLELDFVHYNVPEEVGPIVSALFCAGPELPGFVPVVVCALILLVPRNIDCHCLEGIWDPHRGRV